MIGRHIAISMLVVGLAGCASAPRLAGRAVLPAATFAEGPTSGRYLGEGPINGVEVPFIDRQPTQGFSAILIEGDGALLALSDNGYGRIENSADFHLRIYRLRVDFERPRGGSGEVEVLGFIELRDPDGHIPFIITNQFTEDRVLTGADLDVESFQRAPDGSFWLGDEFGPFLIHADAEGRILEPPISLPAPDGDGELRSPQSPLIEEGSGLRLMNAYRAHALAHGGTRAPVLSPHHLLIADGDESTGVEERSSGDTQASSELFDLDSLRRAGVPVIPWTVNDPQRMRALIELGVDGLITDRPDLLRRVVVEFDGDGDGAPDLLDGEGLLDTSRFDAQGHRGARGLRPENTLPAFEAALDSLVSTLETDLGVTADDVPVLSHEPRAAALNCRPSIAGAEAEPPIRRLTVAELQGSYVCDRLVPRFAPHQRADPMDSPVSLAFARDHGLPSPYAMPTLEQLFEFVAYYERFYGESRGPVDAAEAALRSANAARVRFNVEIKRDPTDDADVADRQTFVRAVTAVIEAAALEDRVDIQSFDHASLLVVQEQHPSIRTTYLVADDTLQTGADGHSPWLAGLPWPWRVTDRDHPVRVAPSGGIEGMALTADGRRLLPLLEKPLAGDEPGALRIFEYDLAGRAFSERVRRFQLHPDATAVGDFIMVSERRGLVIERDDAEGELDAFKWIFQVELDEASDEVASRPLVDLMRLDDPSGISGPALVGDVGVGPRFAFPFFTIECLALLDARRILVANDNNYPFSVGRHAGSGRPDDTELIIIRLASELE